LNLFKKIVSKLTNQPEEEEKEPGETWGFAEKCGSRL
jgi:hypothetical protein